MKKKIRVGKYCAEKYKYPDGVGCTIWYAKHGLCFDFEEKDIDDLIELLGRLKDLPAQVCL